MTNYDDFFAEFPSVSKAEWLRQIAKDLKGRPLEELNWQVSDDLVVSPFAHADDFPVPPQPLTEVPHPWEICEAVTVTDPVAANRQVLDALEGGVESIQFWLETPLDSTAFSQLLDSVYLDYIGLHFAGPGMTANPGTLMAQLGRLAKASNVPTEQLHGSLTYDPAAVLTLSLQPDWCYLTDLVQYAREQFPGFRMIHPGPAPVSTPSHSEVEVDLLHQASLYLEKLTERGIPVDQAAASMHFSITIGKSYFLEIARLRAFKLLWLNVLKAWGATPVYPNIAVRFEPDAYTDDLYTNMIRATTMSMSAVLGGADRLTVLPYDAGREAQATYPQTFSRRMARNVQHLLKMESGFDQLADPAAGSYYIEALTQQLAAKGWMEFRR